jgi:hypothetical protein
VNERATRNSYKDLLEARQLCYHKRINIHNQQILVVSEEESPRREMVPFLSVISNNFEKDLATVRKILFQLEQRSHSDNGYRLSERAEMAAGWWFYDIFVTSEFAQKIFEIFVPSKVRSQKTATIMIVDAIQKQLKANGSEARIRMYGDKPFAAPWWAWLMK